MYISASFVVRIDYALTQVGLRVPDNPLADGAAFVLAESVAIRYPNVVASTQFPSSSNDGDKQSRPVLPRTLQSSDW
jgi:hypothetical protein